MNELAERAGLTPRAVRYYFEQRLLPSPEFRGTATRYAREHLLRLLAIQKLQRDEGLSLRTIRKRFETLAPADLEVFAPPEMPASPVAAPDPAIAIARARSEPTAIEPAPTDPAPPTAPSSPPATPGCEAAPPARLGAPVTPTYAAETWQRIALVPGLELLVRADATPLVLRLAQDIHDYCVAAPASR